jgi:hypothetical protein
LKHVIVDVAGLVRQLLRLRLPKVAAARRPGIAGADAADNVILAPPLKLRNEQERHNKARVKNTSGPPLVILELKLDPVNVGLLYEFNIVRRQLVAFCLGSFSLRLGGWFLAE